VFTGIVEDVGEIVAVEDLTEAARLTIAGSPGSAVTTDPVHGESIAVGGVCLTVVDVVLTPDGRTAFTTDVMRETLTRSALAKVAVGDAVNLERAARLDSRLGGHLVQGHVDGTGTVVSREPSEHWDLVRIEMPPQLSRYLVEKGSITVSGVSLTVVDVDPVDAARPTFSVSLIPTTLQDTTLGRLQPGDLVNLEVDLIAKYVERLTAGAPAGAR
jgi:riboflavin synthase